MSKRIVAKVGEYQKDGQTKGKYVDIGVILSNDNGEYVLLDPAVNLAGIMMKQRILNGKGDSVMASVFTNDNSGYQNQAAPAQQSAPTTGSDGFDDDIPFN